MFLMLTTSSGFRRGVQNGRVEMAVGNAQTALVQPEKQDVPYQAEHSFGHCV